MNKKVLKLSELDLHNIINESVKKTLNEGSDTFEELQEAYDILKNITESDYIPFVTTHPSEIESHIKMTILEAKMLIIRACYLHKKCYGNKPISNAV